MLNTIFINNLTDNYVTFKIGSIEFNLNPQETSVYKSDRKEDTKIYYKNKVKTLPKFSNCVDIHINHVSLFTISI